MCPSQIMAIFRVISSIFGQVVSVLMGAVVTFIAFLIKERYYRRKDERKRTVRKIALLQSAGAEIGFYRGKLVQIKNQIDEIIPALTSEQRVIVPTYTVYPGFIENLKTELARDVEEPDLVKKLSHCHFELAHIARRLADNISMTGKGKGSVKDQQARWGGLRKLVNSNITTFKSFESTLDKRRSNLEQSLS